MVENVVISRKKYEKNVEIRTITYEYELYNAINNTRDGWRRLMGAIPKNLEDLEDNRAINEFKYKLDDMRLIEKEITFDKSRATEILFQEWGTSGRKRPTLDHLFKLLVKLEMFRAADIVANLLGEPKPIRPGKGPAARIDTTLPEAKAKNEEPKGTQSNNIQQNRDLSSKPSPSGIDKLKNLMPIPEPEQSTACPPPSEFEMSALLPCFSKISPRLNSRRLESTDESEEQTSSTTNHSNLDIPRINSNYQHTSPNLSLLNQPDDTQMTNSSRYSPNLSLFNQPEDKQMVYSSQNGNFQSNFPDISMPGSHSENASSSFNIPVHVETPDNQNYQQSFPGISVPLSSISKMSGIQTIFSQSSQNSAEITHSAKTSFTGPPLLSFLNQSNDGQLENGNPSFNGPLISFLNQSSHVGQTDKANTSAYIPDLSQLNLSNSKSSNAIEFNTDELKSALKQNQAVNSVFGYLFFERDKLVKQLKDNTKYEIEKEILERCHHENIVRLIGYSWPNLCLIYEPLFMENLENKLRNCRHGVDQNFGCKERVKVLFESSSALKYLHEHLQIIHLKFGSKNIYFKGVQSKLFNFEESRPINDVITPKIDIFDFGILVFEILTTMIADDRQVFLKNIEEKGTEIIDLGPSMTYENSDVRWPLIANDFLGLGERCTEMDAGNRPNMTFIVDYIGNFYENI